MPNVEFSADESTWNEEAIKAAWAPPPYEGEQRKLDVYSASKTEGERAAWKFMKEQKPGFALNTVLPNCNMGLVFSREHQGAPSTVGWLKALWNEFKGQENLQFNPPQYMSMSKTQRVFMLGPSSSLTSTASDCTTSRTHSVGTTFWRCIGSSTPTTSSWTIYLIWAEG